MSLGLSRALAVAAGALTILSPRVLPLAPIVSGNAAVTVFAAVGLAGAILGGASGLDPDFVRQDGAVMLIIAGAFLLVPIL